MKFKKIDNKTLCCMLSKEDLTDNDITLEDFIHNRDKVQSFLEEIIETAKDEVGFEASGPMLSIQIMAMHPDGVMITFSEDPKDMASAFRSGLEQIREELGSDGWVAQPLLPWKKPMASMTARGPLQISLDLSPWATAFADVSCLSYLHTSPPTIML